MPRESRSLNTFNRGVVGELVHGRQDIDRIAMSASIQTNYVPRVLGSMMLRPGLQYIDSTLSDNPAHHLPFVFSTDDQALIELTNESMRVRVDEEVISRPSVSTVMRGGDFSADITNFLKVDDPATTPTGNANDVAFSPDGQLMAVAHDISTISVTVYYNSGTAASPVWTKLTDPPSLPGTNVSGVAFSPDGAVLAVAYDFGGSGFSRVWPITGTGASASFGAVVQYSIDGPATAVTFSPDGQFVAYAHDTSPFVSIFTVSGTTFTALSDPASLPAGNGNGVAFSSDSRFLAVAHDTTPFVTIYEINGTTFTKLDNPGTLPAGAGQDVKFSRDGSWMAVAHTTTPFVTIYAIDGTTFTKASNPGTLPDANSLGVAFSSDNQFLAVVHGTSPYLSHYRNVAGVWTKQTDPATAPDGTGNRVAFSPNNHTMAVAHDSAAYLTLYQAYQWLDMDGTGASSTYSSGGGSYETAFTQTITGAPPIAAGASGMNVRNVIDGSLLTRAGSKVKLTFKSATTGSQDFIINKCYIGKQAASGSAYDFASAPTPVTFNGGSSGFTIANGGNTLVSDEIVFDFDGSDIIVSFHTVSTTGEGFSVKTAASGAMQAYYKNAADDSGTVNASGYTDMSRDLAGLTKIDALEVVDGGGAGLFFVGTLYNEAKRVQAVSILNADVDEEHALRITVQQGKVMLRVGTEYGEEDLIGETTLGEGEHSLSFTPTTNLFFVQFSSNTEYSSILASCQIEGAGDMTLSTVWSTSDLDFINYAQSGDIVYVACKDNPRYKIERRAERSWSVVKYQPEDGPFRTINTSLITMTPSALSGDITLTASRDFFRETHVGALIKIRSAGQQTSDSFTAQNQFSANNIRVTGVDNARAISITRSGTWSATITLQRSLSEPGNWTDAVEFTSNGTSTYTDDLDNQIVYYRIGIKTGDYTSGTANVVMEYASGGIVGVARVTGFTDRQNVDAITLTRFGSTDASENWAEETWSDFRGHPSAVAIYEGRLGWAGKDRLTLSVSDAYESFDEETEGDSGPINRTIGEGPVDTINWLVSSKTLIMGGQGSEFSVGTTAFDEVLTPSNYHADAVTNIGSCAVAALKIDKETIFASRTRTKVFQLSYQSDIYDYTAADLTRLIPEMCDAGIVRIEYQRYPDTRLHCVLEDGTVALLLFEREEDVVCWIPVTTDGLIEDVVILPAADGVDEDKVYYVVNRTINSETKRYLEKWALESECVGSTLNKQADSFVSFTNGPASATVTGLDHLEGEEVVVWADGKCLDDSDGEIETFTVSSGSISLTNDGSAYTATTGIVGLPYTAQFKSTKLAYAAGGGSAFNRKKRNCRVGLILANTHAKGIKYGDSFDHLNPLPSTDNGQATDEDYIWSHYDEPMSPVVGSWDTDSRLCLQSQAPRPATVLAATVEVETNG